MISVVEHYIRKEYNKLDIVLFGVGQHTDKFIDMIHYFGGTVIYLTDNDGKKVGTMFHGIKVISPQLLVKIDCKIIVSCVHQKEIEVQLSEMGIGDRLILLSSFLHFPGVCGSWKNKKNVICMDLFSKAKWGGAENWNMVLANALAQKGEKIVITYAQTLEIVQDGVDGRTMEFKCFQSEEAFGEIVEYYKKKMPLVFVNTFYGDNFFAALTIKKMYPDKVRIINVIHNDRKSHYALAMLFDEWIDRYLCVSSRIQEKLVSIYGVSEERVNFLHQPIDLSGNFRKRFNNAEPIQLGIASRLAREQKRCDLIPQLIGYLEDGCIDYVMSIAGDGELLETIHDYVKTNNLAEKVKLLGYLGKEKMVDFWEAQDIYINISEYEGTSLSMLEAMRSGCVPLVTDVSGVRDYIYDGYSGFVFDIGDLRHIVEKVKLLDSNRQLLREIGKAASQEVYVKCNVMNYADKLLKIMEDMP